ncbi:MAG TPA: ImmA/IrrE family metallo-endopeptidase [Chloroflexia bacterium]|nr:ImmA/IrrE family metallo-endopeptidase [Chloroflexia bacterium]
MWLEAGLSRLADEFWQLAGMPGPFPRDLSAVASLALPVVTRNVPHLTLADVRQWLHARGIPHPLPAHDRRLRGCLLAYSGQAFILVDGSDPERERRFTVAHELAHFLVDYREPRLRAIAILGGEIAEVLDGIRPPTHTERVHSILGGVPVGLHVDIFERTPSGAYTSPATLQAEERADRLALELLAPADNVWASFQSRAEEHDAGYDTAHQHLAQLLYDSYQLPEEQAQTYATWLLRKAGRIHTFNEWLA